MLTLVMFRLLQRSATLPGTARSLTLLLPPTLRSQLE